SRAERVRAAVDEIATARSTTADVVALAFLMRHPSGIHPVIGTGRVERIEAAVRATALELSREEWFDLWRAATGAPLP
ncbi:MAG: aldo/keto reductase, partial [Planctomycetota bacterium]|nr:aldo/keto reductase [Planctomycetota bacterium]